MSPGTDRPCVAGGGVPPALVESFARRHGLRVCRGGGGQALVGLVPPVPAEELAQRLSAHPWRMVLEVCGQAREPSLSDSLAGLVHSEHGFGVSLSTPTAFHGDLAYGVVGALEARLGQVPAMALRTALQEAVGNAVLHGNLGIAAWSTPERMLEMGRAINRLLDDPERAERRVEVLCRWTDDTIVCAVTDDGEGFRPGEVTQRGPHAVCGRGLAMIRSCTLAAEHSNGGRTLTMTFSRQAEPGLSP
jgi:hypothetical protein